ncbi:hypothetical protein GCM10018793_69730 [Streptomyces sulfonofaciens]|uniref:Uncharacterized protein n=1 Tax=Streptomyces sulfonofaciens TaxID=68272 RepID=A0A919GSB8_9ACTN|nr:hypothetical protein GCM10018793_69730 [Streptomyces sulfonofaciens]
MSTVKYHERGPTGLPDGRYGSLPHPVPALGTATRERNAADGVPQGATAVTTHPIVRRRLPGQGTCAEPVGVSDC